MIAAILTTVVLGARTSLLEQGVAANSKYWRSLTATELERLLTRPVSLESRDIDGCTALIWAARETNEVKVVELLLKAGADPNEKAKNGWTPLHWAATFNRGDVGAGVVKTLLSHGADPTLVASGMTPLEWARRNGNPDVEKMLTQATIAAAAATKELNEAMAGPVSSLRLDKVRLALDAAVKSNVGEATLKPARAALRLAEAMDSQLLKMLEGLGLQQELASLLLEHDILHVDTLAHIDVALLMSTLGLSLGKAARLHRHATQLAVAPGAAYKSPGRQRVEL